MTQPLWRPAYIGVGSNLDDPVQQVRRGIGSLDEMADTLVVLKSSLYRSSPMGPQDQPDFINAVVAVMTQLEPEKLLSSMMMIERGQGRDRSAGRWGPRTLDLDLLAFSSVKMASDELTLPHPGIAERIFVLLPWLEIAPHFSIAGSTTVQHLNEALLSPDTEIQKLDE